MHNGYGLVLAWPKTKVKQVGAWYDALMTFFGFNKNGYYKVGHAALVLINDKTRSCKYYDFGRYQSPFGYGRIRNKNTDFNLSISTKAKYRNGELQNVKQILTELEKKGATNGFGPTYYSPIRLDVKKAENYINKQQKIGFISYGPFVSGGSNCSRFVSAVLLAGKPKLLQSLALTFPLSLTPTPLWNLHATFKPISSLTIAHTKKSRTQGFPNILSKKAQWLSGEGAGSWFVLNQEKSGMIRIKRYTVLGKMECNSLFKSSTKLNLKHSYQIIYPSDCSKVSLIQAGQKTQLELA